MTDRTLGVLGTLVWDRIVDRDGQALFLFSNEVKSHRLAAGERVVVMGPAPVVARLREDLESEARKACR